RELRAELWPTSTFRCSPARRKSSSARRELRAELWPTSTFRCSPARRKSSSARRELRAERSVRSPHRGRGWLRAGRRLDVHVPLTEDDRASALAGLAHPSAELAELRIGVDHVTFDGLARVLIVTAVVDGYPEAAIPVGATKLRPRHSGGHGRATFS